MISEKSLVLSPTSDQSEQHWHFQLQCENKKEKSVN